MNTQITNKRRWTILVILCLGTLMIVLDTTIVNVALPSIKTSLGFSDTSLAWVVNAYMLTFGGFLLLGGRLGDLYGRRKLFLIGLLAFTLASLACGIANTQTFLVAARAIQGLGGAIVSAVGLSLVMNLFEEPRERAKAMGIFGFVAAGGGSLGVLLGGFLTGAFNWHTIFLINLPIGILVAILCFALIPKDTERVTGKLDIFGALTVTLSLLTLVYAIVNGNSNGWISLMTLGLLIFAIFLFIIFLVIESKLKAPLVPLSIFKKRNVRVSNIAGILWSAGMFAWFFLAALYLQLVLGYGPLEVGLSFLPSNIIMALFSIGLSAKLVMRFGIRTCLTVGLSLVTLGLLLFVRLPVDGQFVRDVLPSMILLGFGAGISFNPMLLAAMSDVAPEESGLASGVVNTAFMMGGALGLAVLASVASAHTGALLKEGSVQAVALTAGYHRAFLLGGVFALLAAVVTGLYLRIPKEKEIEAAQVSH